MARRPKNSIPAFKRKRKGRGFFGWLFRIIIGLILFSILWVLAYRFVPPPVTATMLGDLFAGRGINKDWMNLNDMDRDMVRAAIAAEDR
jgi:monofunctional biosynthetic peptidoglycan transglycosylase